MFYLSTNDKGGKKVLFSSLSDLASSATPGDRGWGQVTPFSPTHQLNIYLYKSCVSVWPLAPRFATLNTRSRLFFFDWTENHCSFHWGHWMCWSVRLVTPNIFSLFFDGHKYQNWSTVWRSNDSIISLSVCYLLSLLIGRREAKSLDFDERQHAPTHTEQHTRHWRHNTQNTGPTIFTPIRFQLAIARRLLTGKEDEIKRRVNVPTVSSKWQISNHFPSSSSDQAFQRRKQTRPRFDS